MSTTGSATTGITNGGISRAPAIKAQLCEDDTLHSALSATSDETAIAQSTVDSTSDLSTDPADSWRVEVAARLERYRTRRKPRSPRYPSLLLPFDAFETWSRTAPPASLEETTLRGATSVTTASGPAISGPAIADFATGLSEPSAPVRGQALPNCQEAFSEQPANVIEFPRSAAIPVSHANELADPIFDRPRIVEAPEILPPPPALGGMLIEPVHKDLIDISTDSPAETASLARRAFAAIVDGAVLAIALIACAAVFVRVNPATAPIRAQFPVVAGALAAITALLWMAYEFLFLVYTGATPGLRAARLRLAAFDGSPLDRRSRRWRVLSSFLSAFSAGLGYLWCLLDQDTLCWHDRITRTNVQPARPAR